MLRSIISKNNNNNKFKKLINISFKIKSFTNKQNFCNEVLISSSEDKRLKVLNKEKFLINDRLNINQIELESIEKITTDLYTNQLNDTKRNKIWKTIDAVTIPTNKPALNTLYSQVIKDVINRIKLIQGYKVQYQIGFDCFGVNIEDLAMKKVFNLITISLHI